MPLDRRFDPGPGEVEAGLPQAGCGLRSAAMAAPEGGIVKFLLADGLPASRGSRRAASRAAWAAGFAPRTSASAGHGGSGGGGVRW